MSNSVSESANQLKVDCGPNDDGDSLFLILQKGKGEFASEMAVCIGLPFQILYGEGAGVTLEKGQVKRVVEFLNTWLNDNDTHEGPER